MYSRWLAQLLLLLSTALALRSLPSFRPRGREFALACAPRRPAIIIVDHGSRKKEANDMLFGLASVYKSYAKADIVEAAHMELAEPSIKAAYQRCVEQGATHIVCHPFFLAPGRHVQEDIPLLMKEAASEYPDVTYAITSPLGLQEGIVQLIDQAIKSAE